jgi:ketosteroid isomerase-like protein
MYKEIANNGGAGMTEQEARDFLQAGFDALFNPAVEVEQVSRYFSPDYRQDADGVILDYPGFLSHIRVLKSGLATGTVTIEKVLSDGTNLISVHYIDAVKKDQSQVKFKVIAWFTTENGKITRCDELTHLLAGDQADRDIGSRTE